MYVPNGVKRWRQEGAVDNKDDAFELELSFGGDSEEVSKYRELMKEYDEIVKQKIQTSSLEWIGKPKASMETIEDAFYLPTVKPALDKNKMPVDYPDRIKLKIDRQKDTKGNFTGNFVSDKKSDSLVSIYDTERTLLEFNEDNYDRVIPKGCYIICLIELVYINITSKVSTKWKLVQAKVFKQSNTIEGYSIDDGEEEDREDEAPVICIHDEEEEIEAPVRDIHKEEEELDLVELNELLLEDKQTLDAVKEEIEEVTPTPVKRGGRKRAVN
jgi:hypothetical protein